MATVRPMAPALGVGTPVEMAHARRSGSPLRGVVAQVLTRDRLAVLWVGASEWQVYRRSELRQAEQDDRGVYSLQLPLEGLGS